MVLQSRKILLFLDNCGAHPAVHLQNVKLVFFPPNTTSRLQPLDAGIIQTVKLHYRKKMMRHVAIELEEADTASEIARSINVLHGIQWLTSAWDSVKEETITKCFKNCGFLGPASADPQEKKTGK